MEEPGSPCVEAPAAASLRRKNKGKAPRPPAETQSLESSSTFDLEYAMMEQKENLDKEIELTVVLPDEVTSTSVSGSKPMMDLLIFLCAQYHLNPSAYTIDLVSADRNQVKFKPNTPVGMLEVEKVILKPKKLDDKNKKPTPVIPEQTVRVVINYKNTQKAVVRVSPCVSLQELIPIISSKCELDPLHTILMKDNQSQEPLDVTKSLNDLGLRDLYALDTSRESCQIPQNVDMQKQKEDEKGFFSFLRRSKKKREQAASAPATPLLTNQRPANIMKPNMTFKQYESNTLPSELPKKRRAPLPPMYASQTVPKDFVQGQTRPHSCVVKSVSTDGEHKDLTGSGIVRTGSLQLSGTSSNDSSLRRAKRKAPPPPSPPCQPPQAQMDENSNETENSPIKSPISDGHAELPSITAGVVFEYSLEEIDEKEESSICHKEASEATPLETPDVSIPALSTDVPLSTEEDKCVSTPENIASGSSKSPEEKQEPLNPDGKVMHSTSDSTDTGEMILENNTELLDLNKHEDKPENNILTVPGEEKENLTKTIEVHSTNVTQFIISKDDGTYENGILKNPPFIKDGKSKLNSTSTAVVKTQDAAIQTASSQTNDDQNISENIDPEGCTTGRVKEMGNVHWTVDKLPLKSTSSTHQSVQVETEFVAQRQETAVIKESSCAYTNDIFIPTESNMQSPIRSLSKGYAFYRHNSEPKPKPSNEITREYIPKIGMTTYKIVPQKSLEIIKSENLIEVKNLEYDSRLQGLETSESVTQSHFVYEPSADVRNRQYDTSTITDTNEVSPSKHCTNASQTKSSTVNNNGAPLLMLKKDTTNTSFEKKDKQNDTFPKARTNSFYSQLQRRVSGQYVTSAAAKSATSPTSPTQNEPVYKMTEENVPLSPQHTEPSTNRTIHSSELIQNKPDGSHYERKSDDIVIKPPVMPPLISPKPFTVPSSPSKPLSLQKLRTFTAPRPYSTTAPSPFALAVSSAVKRSQSFSKTCTTNSQPLKGDSINTFSSATSPTEVNNNSSESFLGSSNDRTLEQKKNFTNTENNNKVQYTPLVLEKKNTLLFQNSDPEQIRQSLLAAIRSGDAAAKLKRVCVQPNTISINGRSRLIHPVSTEVPYKQ